MSESKRLPPSIIEKWVNKTLPRYAVLSGIDANKHWSAQLVAIMLRLDYTPDIELYARPPASGLGPREAIELIGYAALVEKQVTKEMLEDLQVTLELVESGSPVEVLALRDNEGNLADGVVFIDENSRMVYTDHGKEEIDLSKDRGTSWGSW